MQRVQHQGSHRVVHACRWRVAVHGTSVDPPKRALSSSRTCILGHRSKSPMMTDSTRTGEDRVQRHLIVGCCSLEGIPMHVDTAGSIPPRYPSFNPGAHSFHRDPGGRKCSAVVRRLQRQFKGQERCNLRAHCPERRTTLEILLLGKRMIQEGCAYRMYVRLLSMTSMRTVADSIGIING